MIRTGTLSPAIPAPPALLPGLTGDALATALTTELRRLAFLAEHLDHPTVSEGVVDAVSDALFAIAHAAELHARLTALCADHDAMIGAGL